MANKVAAEVLTLSRLIANNGVPYLDGSGFYLPYYFRANCKSAGIQDYLYAQDLLREVLVHARQRHTLNKGQPFWGR